jgi:hypothetical protein
LGFSQLTELPEVEDIFEVYDQPLTPMEDPSFSMDKKSIKPNIYTADGLTELINTFPRGAGNGEA